MKKDKDIEKLFQEGFNKMKLSPSPRVWENVRHELDKKKKRKVIPLWIRIGSVAAFLVLFFSVGYVVWNTDSEQVESPITSAPTLLPEIENEKSPDIESYDSQRNAGEPEVVTIDSNAFEKSEKSENKILEHTNSMAVQPQNKTSPDKRFLLENKNESSTVQDAPSEKIVNPTDKNDTSNEKFPEAKALIAKTDILNQEENTEETTLENQADKPSIFDAIAEVENTEDAVDEKEKNSRRWQITPNVAPVYYNSVNGGSSIDPSFAQNPVYGDINMSYGVQVSYAVSNRLNIRTGINAVDLQYATGDIIPATGPASRGLKGVNYHSNAMIITAVPKFGNHSEELTLKSGTSDARLVQSINYVEVPLEVSYAILNDRFGVQLIGGMSTLLLGTNEISIQSPEYNTSLGAANNLSSLSFSTNIGLGINYQLSSRFKFSLEPMFKYQLNPYSDSSVDFKPYYMGIYSGLSFRF